MNILENSFTRGDLTADLVFGLLGSCGSVLFGYEKQFLIIN